MGTCEDYLACVLASFLVMRLVEGVHSWVLARVLVLCFLAGFLALCFVAGLNLLWRGDLILGYDLIKKIFQCTYVFG